MRIDYPLLRTFEVSSSIVEFLDRKFEDYKSKYKSCEAYPEFNNFNNERINSGYQTDNLLDWDDKEYKNFINTKLLELVSEQLLIPKNKISYRWNHMLEYIDGGEMGVHNHCHHEDFVFFVYLSTCNSGNTIFYLNNFDNDSVERTTVSVSPQKNKAAIFSSLIYHRGEFTKENKKLYVAGIKIDNRKNIAE